MTYLERLKQSDEQLSRSKAQARAAEVKSDIESKIASKNAQIIRLSNQADSLLNQYPLNLEGFENAHARVRVAEAELENLETIHQELFSEAAE